MTMRPSRRRSALSTAIFGCGGSRAGRCPIRIGGRGACFLEVCPKVERFVVDTGVRLIKFWLEVGDEEQKSCFEARIADPLRQWKLSTMDPQAECSACTLLKLRGATPGARPAAAR